MPISSVASWRSYISSKKELDASNLVFFKIKDAVSVSTPFVDSFEIISKNEGISFLLLDPSETELQLFHHGTILGRSRTNPEKHPSLSSS
jgi:hypothetical protein